MLYQLVVYLHVIFVFGYLLAHGVSAGAAFTLKYGEARRAAGIRYNVKGKWFSPEPSKSDEEVFAIFAKTNPTLLTVIGYGGFAVIAWLMLVKPF